MTLLLSKTVVEQHASLQEMMDEMASAFLAFSLGDVEMPQRVKVRVQDPHGYGTVMPCAISNLGLFGVKVNTNFKSNPLRLGIPSILGLILLLDIESGAPLAIMDSTLITALRTAAVSALAVRLLAQAQVEALGVLGSGVQAVAHIRAISEIRAIKTVRVFSPSLSSKASTFLKAVGFSVNPSIEIVRSAREAVQGAEIVVTATDSTEPVLDGDWLKDGCCVVAVGNATPEERELDSTTIRRSLIVCDSTSACLSESGDLLIPIAEGVIKRRDCSLELSAVIHDPTLVLTKSQPVILFKSVGLAFQDIVAAAHVYERAMKQSQLPAVDFFGFGSATPH